MVPSHMRTGGPRECLRSPCLWGWPVRDQGPGLMGTGQESHGREVLRAGPFCDIDALLLLLLPPPLLLSRFSRVRLCATP